MNLKIATRLWLPTFAMIGVLAVAAVATSALTRDKIDQADAELRAQEAKLIDAASWQGLTSTNASRVVASVLSEDEALSQAFKPEIEATTAAISEIQKRIEAAATASDEVAALAKVAEARKAYIAARTEAINARAKGDAVAARTTLMQKVQPALTSYLASQQAFAALQVQHGQAVRARVGEDRMRTVWAVVGMIALVVGGLALSTVLQVRAICRPMGELQAIARRIGEGDLAVDIDHLRNDEIGQVMQSLASMRDALRGIVGQVRLAADSIQVASSEVAAGNGDLSHRTEQAASQLQQTASSMEQLTGNVRQSADAAAQANQLAASATSVAQRGGAVVAQVVSTMDEINTSSKRIADIIGTIDGIAFQTNILALNAAVEAARAGEQGRGFAVVAGEVRSLAQRSAEAAREIKSLIGTSVERVEAGARLVQDAGSTMGEIVTSVQRVSDIINEITAASSEQSQGIGQVNQAVGSLDQMTQQNAALVEQSAAAAESLREQAGKLGQVMQVFRTGVAGGTSRPAPAPANAPHATQARAPAPPPSSQPAPSPAPAPAPSSHALRTPAATPARSTAPATATASAGPSDDWETF